MSMRQTVRKNPAECTGCGACVSICPKQAITMQPDAEGFLYPKVDGEKCVSCDLCEKRCPAGHCQALLHYEIDPEKCKGCTACTRVCPAGAISGTPRHAHTIDVSKCLKCGACMEKCKFYAISRK